MKPYETKQYDYATNVFGFAFPQSQDAYDTGKSDLCCKPHEIDESAWQTDDYPHMYTL